MNPAILVLAVGCTLTAPAAQESRPAAERQRFRVFAAELPTGWRAMTPDEMFALEPSLPYLMRETQPGFYFSLGPVDQWLATGFDGNAIVVRIQPGEIPIEQQSIDAIRANWAQPQDGIQREFVTGEITSVGKDDHPAIRCELKTAARGVIPATRATEFYIPTSGDLLILSFRSWQDESDRVAPIYDAIVDSLTFPRPPRGAEELSDRLYHAAIIGGIVGVALIILRMMLRRPARQ